MMLATRLKEGLNPYVPHHAAGMRTDPPPSSPSATAASPAAAAAALPPEEPPALRPIANGVLVGPKRRLSVVPRKPNSGRFVLPRTIAPARSSRSTESAECGGTQSANGLQPNVFGTPALKC